MCIYDIFMCQLTSPYKKCIHINGDTTGVTYYGSSNMFVI